MKKVSVQFNAKEWRVRFEQQAREILAEYETWPEWMRLAAGGYNNNIESKRGRDAQGA